MFLLRRFWNKAEEPALNIKVAAYAVEGVFWLGLGYVFGRWLFQVLN